jgi:hypothetical protein
MYIVVVSSGAGPIRTFQDVFHQYGSIVAFQMQGQFRCPAQFHQIMGILQTAGKAIQQDTLSFFITV